MQIGQYISDLLYRHDCVVIPGYGAILSRRVAAQHFESSHTIYPPKKGLSFNAQIQQNDGLLAQHIASVEQIPYADAVQKIRNYVRFLDNEIDKKGQVTIHKVGRFTRNEEQSLQFTPMYVVNYLPEAFGLTAHETYAVDRTVVEQPLEVPAVVAMEESIVEDETPVIPLTREEEPPARRRAWLGYAAIGLVALAALGYGGNYQYNRVQADQQIAIEELAKEKKQQLIQEASIAIPSPLPTIELEVTPQIKNYHIVAGAFRDASNADKKVTQLQKIGIDASRIGVNKYGLHNVAFGSFVERNDAINELYRLRKLGYSGAWLLTGQLEK